ncbi:MAG TPA: Gfo/Idh/MocA family oxidoreductase [Mycobacteriales bacterium]|nr:Gfo/Idh/MocA family oxidoreductase [Mycobacteriales bacterium]
MSAPDSPVPFGVGMVGYAFMGAAHSQAWRTAGRVFDLPLDPRMAVLCGRNRPAVTAAAQRLGWASVETDWKAVLQRDDVQLVDICTPGSSHAEIAVAALAAGKHVLCEKPLANTVAEARAMTAAAREAGAAGVRSMVGFNYRRVPAVAFARQLVAAGRIGTVRHVRAQYLQDWIVDPQFPLVWRLRADQAGSGALGDIGAHIVDLTQFVTGQRLTGVNALLETFVRQRPLPSASSGLSASGGTEVGDVTVDDAALFFGRLDGGAIATYEAPRFATGRKNAIRVEVNGSTGSLAFDLERLNELEFLDGTEDPELQGFRRVVVTEPGHPYLSGWYPPGHVLGWGDTFVHEVKDLVDAVAAGKDPLPSFEDGLQVQLVLDAVQRSAEDRGCWTEVEEV